MSRLSNPTTVVSAMESLRADFAAAKSSRYRRSRSVPGMGAGADYHVRSDADYLRMMEIARDMDRNDIAIGRLLDVAALNTLQQGIRPEFDTGDVETDALVKQDWEAWADTPECTLDGAMNYSELEALCFRSMLLDGGCYPILTESDGRPRIQTMEAHRLRTPQRTVRNIKLGVQTDSLGRVTHYWFTKVDIDGRTPVKVGDMRQVAATDEDGLARVLPIIKRKRVSQTVGITALAPMIETAAQFEDIQFSKLVQSQIASCLTFIEKVPAEYAGRPEPTQTGPRTLETQSDGSTRVVDGLSPGLMLRTPPGGEIQGFSPGIPNPEYFPHVRLTLTLLTINMGVPLCIFMLDGSETNFSGWRGAIDQARIGWRQNQRLMVARFHEPIWKWWVRYFIAERAEILGKRLEQLKPPEQWARFNPPGYPYIQPVEDAKAFALRIQTNQSSLRREHAQIGSKWDDVSQELVDDRGDLIVKAIIRADEINAKYKNAGVSWRELAGVEVKPLDTAALLADDPNDKQAKTNGGPNERT